MIDRNEINQQLMNAMGGIEALRGLWSWRSFSPDKRADQALREAGDALAEALQSFQESEAQPELIEEWKARFIGKWCTYMHAGGRVANPMITGPARFPVERNRKAMEAEMKRGDEFWKHANGARDFLRRKARSEERAAKSEEAAAIAHKEQEFGGVRVIYNEPLERIQLIFPDKPDAEVRAALKGRAFRWSPREGAWQRKLTNNGVAAARHVLQDIGAMPA